LADGLTSAASLFGPAHPPLSSSHATTGQPAAPVPIGLMTKTRRVDVNQKGNRAIHYVGFSKRCGE
jgi:hypothetical protein